MQTVEVDRLAIGASEDIVRVRQAVRANAIEIGMSLVDQTKVVTAASELARNALQYGGGGFVLIAIVRDGRRTALRLVFEDSGPGMADVDRALEDGFTTGGGLGLGLGGAKRLSHEFAIRSEPGEGTTVTITRWT